MPAFYSSTHLWSPVSAQSSVPLGHTFMSSQHALLPQREYLKLLFLSSSPLLTLLLVHCSAHDFEFLLTEKRDSHIKLLSSLRLLLNLPPFIACLPAVHLSILLESPSPMISVIMCTPGFSSSLATLSFCFCVQSHLILILLPYYYWLPGHLFTA